MDSKKDKSSKKHGWKINDWVIYIILLSFLSVCIIFSSDMGGYSVLIGYLIGLAMYHYNPLK